MKEITLKRTNTLQLYKDTLANSMSYPEYRALVADHVIRGTSSGPEQTEALSQYTLLNDSRMRRLDKTTKVSEEIIQAFKDFKGNQTWLVLTESWCGDAAQTMPVMNVLANLSENIDFKVALRDENLEVMNQFLTNGSLSIPKLIVLNNKTNKLIATWGPRPSVASKMVAEYKTIHGVLTPEFKQELQVWYNKDKGQNTIQDLKQLIS
ncbi:thioredoxin family protein [Jejudonia soesokkakensis]|uniref:Thioredoxin family protein n=1 Tax=Jejudonia soesokkakensis TaxID=1323432 RepID=A0ABW2MYP7_9FLAO